MTRMFRILLPTTLPTVISAFPRSAAVMLTAASGALVPMATIVRPMTSCGIPNFSAILEAPSTKKSDPFISITNPTHNNSTEPINSISLFLLASAPDPAILSCKPLQNTAECSLFISGRLSPVPHGPASHSFPTYHEKKRNHAAFMQQSLAFYIQSRIFLRKKYRIDG